MMGACAYVLLFLAATGTGLPVGFALFGRRHPAGWIAGLLLGYGIAALALWTVVQSGGTTAPAFALALAAAHGLTWTSFRALGPWVVLPEWRRRDSYALLLVLLLVPALQWRPFWRLGEVDDTGSRRYRAYFTADVLWHVALTAELSRFSSPPRNPYLSRRPLHYYWGYFVLPAVIVGTAPVLPDVLAHLLVNAALAGLLFLAAVFVCAWSIVPRAGPVAMSIACVVLASSAEGAYAIWDYWQRGRSIENVTELNIDAITSWWFGTLTMDGLPRSLWYTPQHATACALSLLALTIAASAGKPNEIAASLAAGLALGLALVLSPFLGGAFCVIYGLAAAWTALRAMRWQTIGTAALAALPVAASFAWCVTAGTFEGAGGAVAIGLSRRAAEAPGALLGLGLGPVLVLAALAMALRAWREWALAVPVIAVASGLFLLFFVTLTLEPVWIGWRAGQIILVTIPALVAAAFARLWDAGRRGAAAAVASLTLAVGLPTTIIDAYNAQDVSNTAEAAGFRWTLVIPPDTQAALACVRERVPRDARVQMSIGPRRRDSWTLVPTFAERRMAAGRPISLLQSPEYDELSDRADAIFATEDAAEAARIAGELRIDYLFLDGLDLHAFGPAAVAKFRRSASFSPVCAFGDSAVYAVR